MQQSSRLAGTLSATNDRDITPAETAGIGVLAGMTDQGARQAVELRRPVLVIEQTGRHHHTLGEDACAVVEDEIKPAVARDHLHDRSCVEIRRHAFLKPGAVIDEIFHRQ